LPGTLFILSGRPPPGDDDAADPIWRELDDPHQTLPVRRVNLTAFDRPAALAYLDESAVAVAVSAEEKQKLVHLTRGHPLWLALTLDFLVNKGIPEEAEASLAEIEREVPYQGAMTAEGEYLHEAFKRRVVTPYRDADFWHEATKRLAVVRRSVNKEIWRRLMEDRARPGELASWDEAWNELLRTPWIRPRANRRYVTLHDALADELAERIVPVHDQDRHWRHELWRRVIGIYGELIEGPEAEISAELKTLDEKLKEEGERALLPREEGAFMEEAGRLDTRRRELDQLKAARLYYKLLSDFGEGSRQFLDLLEQAKKLHDVPFQDLIVLEMQRFLPNGVHRQTLGHIVGGVIEAFHEWLSTTSPESYLEIGLSIGGYLVANEQPERAVELLGKLPRASAAPEQRYRLHILLGNAYMRIPGRVKDGADELKQALAEATELESPDRHKLIAEAHKELGFYYRNEGMWGDADEAYKKAHDVISATLSPRSSPEDREEMASIQTNWAYVKGLRGSYREGFNLVESAINVRQRLDERQGEGTSWSVCGEVYRYDLQYPKAWEAYGKAERIFQELRNWSWLGLIY